MNKTYTLFLLAGLSIIYGCASIQSGQTSDTKNKTYTEDISQYRAKPPQPTAESTDSVRQFVKADSTSLPVTSMLNTVLDTAASHNRKTIKYIDGFTIQVYAGKNRSKAKDYQLDIIRNLPDLDPKMVFEQPNYKVRIGQYYTRLEAQELFLEVKNVFPKAILIPTRIFLN